VNRTLKITIIRVFLLFLTALPTWSSGRVLAAGLDDKAAGDLQHAKRLYKSGKYEEAAEIFSQLSAAHPDFPVFARNAGACYYYLQRPEPAISNLRDYLLSQKGITADDHREVEGWISEMEKIRDQNAARAAPAPATSDPTSIPNPGIAQPIDPVRAPNDGTPPQGYGTAGAPPQAYGPAGYGYSQGYPPPSAPGPTGVPGPAQPAVPGQFPNTAIAPQGYGTMAASPPVSPPPPGYGYSQGYPPAAAPGQQPYPIQPAYQAPYPPPPPPPSQSQPVPAVGVSAESSRQPPEANNSLPWLLGGLGVAVLATGGVFTFLSQSAFSDTAKQYDANKESSGKKYAAIGGVCYGLGAAGVLTGVIMLVRNDHHSSSSVALAPVVGPDAVGALLHYTY
jgi:hypothetical protein